MKGRRDFKEAASQRVESFKIVKKPSIYPSFMEKSLDCLEFIVEPCHTHPCMLAIEELCFNFEKRKILEGFSLSLKKGETVAVIGTSGSGKTTLLRLICGSLIPHSGQVIAPPHSQAYMSQQDLLLPWRTVEDNIKLSLELEKLPLVREEIYELLERLEIIKYRHSYPHELSGGQYKRAMLARTLAPKKNILLLDEAFSSLDLPLRDKLYGSLRELTQATTLLVTHDFRDAFSLADRIVLLDRGKIGAEWRILPELREDASYVGALFSELKSALALSATS